MAHKHNRRRIRPRSRDYISPTLTSNITDDISTSSNSPTHLLSGYPTTGVKQLRQPRPVNFHRTTTASSTWTNRHVPCEDRDRTHNPEGAKKEAEQIKIFGGEPGDDIGLCYKMLEVFEGMGWVDSLD